MRRRQQPDPQFVTDLISMFGVSTVEQAQARIAEEDARFDVAKQLAMPARNHESVVYYMRMDRLVKIGITTNITARVSTIMPQGVLAVEPGGRDRERHRHRQFSQFHSHLEWYWLKPPIWEHIVSIRAQLERAHGFTTEYWLKHHGIVRAAPAGLLDQADDLGFT